MKAMGFGLWMIWLCGFFLIGISFYATTQILPYSLEDHQMNKQLLNTGSVGPKITIFSAVKPFSGSVGIRQSLAVRSWLGLSPDITVVLFSQDPSVFSFTGAFGSRVSVEPNIDFTFLGTPFFHSMIARARASTSAISVVMDSETILFSDFVSTLNYVHKLDHDWLLVSSPRNVTYFPFHLDADRKHWLSNDGNERIRINKLQAFLANRQWKQCEEKIVMAWNNRDLPLHTGVLPPFLYGKGFHTHWILNEALLSDIRFVFDASSTISNFYLNDLGNSPYEIIGGLSIPDMEERSWEIVGNSYLATHYGLSYFLEANYSSMLKLFNCDTRYLFANTAENIVYHLGPRKRLSFKEGTICGSRKSKKSLNCLNMIKSVDGNASCSMKNHLNLTKPLSLPFSLELLLSRQADENKTIVLAIAGYSYKDMLMSWVCRLRHLLISNFLVCALDDEIYDFCVFQGLPVFKDSFAPNNISFDGCHFGTECFQRVTKVKSRLVLHILKLGYNLLLSDVDVYWFKNPLPLLTVFGPAVLVAQSDEYNKTGPINLPRRLNSGFYYVRSDSSTIAALEKVVKHAATSNLSEQPSFYDTLCGLNGSNRVGDDKCLEPETNLIVHFLDRSLFPNGAYEGLWEESDVEASCVRKGCYVLHNNWISGRRKKLERQVSSGLWAYDISTRMCLQSWQMNKTMLKRLARIIRLVHSQDRDARKPKDLKDCSISEVGVSIQSKDISVRIIHPGRREELFPNPVPASQLMDDYPGMCVAWPEVFKNPHCSVLSENDVLLPGLKYYLVPCTTVSKLKRNYSGKGMKKSKERDEALAVVPYMLRGDKADLVSPVDFYASKEKWSTCLLKKHRRGNRPFVPPIQKSKTWKSLDWEPSLKSVQEEASP